MKTLIAVLDRGRGGDGSGLHVHADAERRGRAGFVGVVGEASMVTVRGWIDAVDKTNRTVTLKGPRGGTVTLDVKDPKKLDAVAVGDPVVAAFIEALALQVKKVPGATPGVSVTEARMTSKPGETPSGAVGREVVVTATITAVDRKAQTVTIKGPRGQYGDHQGERRDEPHGSRGR